MGNEERSMGRLTNKVAIVTGGAMGIGRATCLALAREGAAVAVTDIADDQGQGTVEEILRSGGRARYWHVDVGDESAVKQAFSDIHAAFGRIDVLVNNAGICGKNKPTHELSEQEWDRVFAINVKGVFFCTKHVIGYMRQNGGGSIVNISSMYGLIGAGDDPAYHATKAAVWMMSKNDAVIYARDQIRVNSVHPGYIWTPLTEKIARSLPGGVEAQVRHFSAKQPLGRIGQAEEVAWGIVYLAADESKFVTGTELVIDGGYTAQ